ncbi:MAG: alpha/beta fold hydrolase [Sandaracinaceae bacterium]|nr:MAG: alpha/beta fold hydrolase [Sandaracinaceae bacterium]
MESLAVNKSTIDRSSSEKFKKPRRAPKAPGWMRGGLSAVEALSPEAAGRIAAHLFFQTRRMRVQPSEIFERGRAFGVPFEGERLAARSWGDGPTVILGHGWNGRATQLAPFIGPLVAAGFRVVAFDHVGHGESTGRATNLGQMVRALRTMTDGEHGPVGLVAHSLGAAAATVALADGLDTFGAVLIAPPISPKPWVAQMGQLLGLGQEALGRAQAHIEARVGRSLDAVHGPTLAREIAAPALIVHDRDDREVPLACGEALHGAWTGSRLVVTEGLGHRRLLGDVAVREATRDFLSLTHSGSHSMKIGLE